MFFVYLVGSIAALLALPLVGVVALAAVDRPAEWIGGVGKKGEE